MVQYFGSTESRIQDILTWNFIGLCLSCLFYGPLSDSYGRKPLLCFGLLLFTLSSIACTVATTVDQLVVLRFIQGLGCGAITGIASTMVFDVFPKNQSAQLITVLNSFITGMMAVAPLLGSWINLQFGWQMNFIVVAIGAVLSLLITYFLVAETHAVTQRHPFNVGHILGEYKALLTNFTFMGNSFIWTTMFGMLIVFTSNLSLIYIDYLHVDPVYFGFYQAAVMTTFFVSSLLASGSISRFGTSITKWIGNGCFIGGALLLMIFAQPIQPDPFKLTLAMSLCSAGVAIACVIYFMDSMADFPNAKGAANALAQSLRLIVGAGMIALAASAFNGTIMPIALMAMATVVGFAVITLRLKKQKMPI